MIEEKSVMNKSSLTEVGKGIGGDPTEAIIQDDGTSLFYRGGKLLPPFVPEVRGYKDWK